MATIVDSLRARVMAWASKASLDQLGTLPAVVLGIPAEGHGRSRRAPVSTRTSIRRPRLCKRINHDVTARERQVINKQLGALDHKSPQYRTKRDKICRRFKLTPKQVAAVVTGPKVWAKRKSAKSKE